MWYLIQPAVTLQEMPHVTHLCGNLVRALETAEIYALRHSIPFIIRIIEQPLGDISNHNTRPVIAHTYPYAGMAVTVNI